MNNIDLGGEGEGAVLRLLLQLLSKRTRVFLSRVVVFLPSLYIREDLFGLCAEAKTPQIIYRFKFFPFVKYSIIRP